MHRTKTGTRGERGIALVMAILILLTLSLLAVVLTMAVNVETKVSGHGTREAAALNTAEAGVAEVISRIRSQEINLNQNPRAVAVIYNVSAGSVPSLGTDSTGLPTAQPAGAWLNYTTSSRDTNALKVQYRTNAGRTLIYKYDPTKNPAVQTVSGYPIYQITSVGREKGDTRRIVSEVIQKPLRVAAKGAFACGTPINFGGNNVVCGYNHRIDTPFNTGDKGRSGNGGCNENPGLNQWEVGSGDLAGAWSSSSVDNGGGGNIQEGNPAVAQTQPNFFAGPWEVLNMSQSEFYAWVGPRQATAPATPHGIYYLDNNTTHQDQGGSFSYGGVDGDGFLYVDGDLSLNSQFHFVGLIYVEGDIKINGHAWILGGLVVRGKGGSQQIANGASTILYSQDAIQQSLMKYGGQFVNLSWRELPY